MVVLGVCLGSLQLARVRVPAVLSGDDVREGRRRDSCLGVRQGVTLVSIAPAAIFRLNLKCSLASE